MNNIAAVNNSSGGAYMPNAAAMESTASFSEMLVAERQQAEQTQNTALQSNSTALQSNGTAAQAVSDNISTQAAGAGTGSAGDAAPYQGSGSNNVNAVYTQPNTENTQAAAAQQESGIDSDLLLMALLMGGMGGGMGGMVSAMVLGTAMSNKSTANSLKQAFSNTFGGVASNVGGTGAFTANMIQTAKAGALSVPYNAWVATTPSVVSNVGERSPQQYRAVIEQFDVENHGRYAVNKQGYGDTYCNIFMWDVTSAMGAEIPHFINKHTAQPTTSADKDAIEMTANSTYDWLHKYGADYGWTKVDQETAQAYANQGKPAVSIYKASGHGHAQIISPSADGAYDASKGAAIAQAGRKLYNYAYTSDVYGSGSIGKVAFFVHE